MFTEAALSDIIFIFPRTFKVSNKFEENLKKVDIFLLREVEI